MGTTPARRTSEIHSTTPAPSKNTSDQLAEFEQTFKANLAYFAQHHPELHQFATQHHPSHTVLAIDDQGFPNLFTEEKPFYNEDPIEHSKRYLKQIEENPICISCLQSSQRQSPPPKDSFLHQRYLFEIEHLVPVNHQDKRLRLHGIAPLCAIIGVGTGHIIEQITQQYDIQNLLIYEPDPDVFYASLFTTRYTTIARHYQTNYRTLTFIIGANSSAFCNRVDALFQQHGHFLLARFLLIEHRPTPDTRTAITHLRNIIHRSVRGWGFFEDEIISVSQSLHNLQHGTPLIGPLSPKAHDALHNMPVFVVANGPSLDHDIDFIKAHSQTAVIVSVGSTIYTLYRHNIKPDFHVEIERSPAVGTYLERLTDPSYRQDVTLLTQNPIHPSVIAQFSRTLISLKVNDAGTGLMQLLYPNQIDENWPVYFTHPLVGNGGVATLVRLGFTNLYLFG
ncbi:MAG: DUF115 domain-containing protein, partial [Gammaproteobacteria bacterium]